MTHFEAKARQMLTAAPTPLAKEPGIVKGIVDAQTHATWIEYIAGFSTSSAEAARA